MERPPKALTLAQLARHFDHGPPELGAGEHGLSDMIPFRGEEDHARGAEPPQIRERRIHQPGAHALSAVIRIDHKVVEHARRPAQRHMSFPSMPA